MIIQCARENCKNKFDRITPQHKYCSPTCKQISWALRQVKNKRTFKIAKIALILVVLCSGHLQAESAGNAYFLAKNDYFERVVDSIYLAEGGKNTNFPYGIKSVKCSGEKECRQVCKNTVVNNYARWQKSDKSVDYITFLANRYCPIGAENDNGTNKFWKQNVNHFLEKL